MVQGEILNAGKQVKVKGSVKESRRAREGVKEEREDGRKNVKEPEGKYLRPEKSRRY